MNYSLNWLKDEINKGSSFVYLFFWGHTQKKDGIIDKSCFSQWYPSAFVVDDILYATAEHWMMANKAKLFNDIDSLNKILASEKPSDAKALGKKVKNFDADIWAETSYSIVVQGNQHKFSQNDALRNYLNETDKKIIVEASPVDGIWGIGLPLKNESAQDPFKWKGTNLLGFALMEARDFLKN